MASLLQAQGITHYYGGVCAVDDVDFEVERGEILGVIGPNGAGKTTLMNIISGTLRLREGVLTFDGTDISRLPPHRRARLGIARTFQIMKPLYGLPTRDNVCAAALFGRNRLDLEGGRRRADELLNIVGLSGRGDVLADALDVEETKRLELARALAAAPELLLLDEILAGLTPEEGTHVLSLIEDIRQQGVTVIFIEHIMKAVMNLCDRVMVLHNGARIACDTPSSVADDPEVIRAYLGSEFETANS